MKHKKIAHKSTVVPETKNNPPSSQPSPNSINPLHSINSTILITCAFFVIALFGIMHHEMWRDEHQAWLVTRDAHSLPQLFQNMRYEGNPALWHLLLYLITCFTHDPFYMQLLHLAIACGFIFVFNYYSGIGIIYKALFSFGYFSLYEYAVISRSYGLGILLIFIACALYKNRASHYILLGIILGLLANVTIFGLVVAFGAAGIIGLDYIFYQAKNRQTLYKLLAGGAIVLIGILLSIYQIMPDKNNSFPAFYAKEMFDFVRWGSVASRLFVTYFYIPNIHNIHFWNTNFFIADYIQITPPFGKWFNNHPSYLWGWFYMPVILYLLSLIIFIRKPLIALLYAGATFGIISVFYYTDLIHLRYSGYLLIILISCYWLADYYPDHEFNNKFLKFASNFGMKIKTPFLVLVLATNLIGAILAYSVDVNNKFSVSKDAADYIKESKLDTLTIAGASDFTVASIASYLDTKIFYPQMNDYGSFCVWSKQRINNPGNVEIFNSVKNLVNGGKSKVLVIFTYPIKVDRDGKSQLLEHALIQKDIKMDLLKSFEGGIVEDEKYFIYLTQKVDPSKEDLSSYPLLQ